MCSGLHVVKIKYRHSIEKKKGDISLDFWCFLCVIFYIAVIEVLSEIGVDTFAMHYVL